MTRRIPVLEKHSWQPQTLAIENDPQPRVIGARYIVGDTPTGEWSLCANCIAWADVEKWNYDVPEEGWMTWVQSDQLMYIFLDGEWQIYYSPVAPHHETHEILGSDIVNINGGDYVQ